MGVHAFADAPTVIASRRKEVDALVNSAARRVIGAASSYLTQETPVKVGVARSNWVATLDVPFESIIPAYAPFPDLGHDAAPPERKFESENRDAARAQNQTAFNLFNYLRNRSIFLRNNAEHIGLLNDGHSRQTGPGFFERGVDAARAAIAGVWRLKA